MTVLLGCIYKCLLDNDCLIRVYQSFVVVFLTLRLMLSVIYYANNYAGIIGWSLKVISIVASHSYILYP